MKIGIIGYGFVGAAIARAHHKDELIIKDPKLESSADYPDFVNCDAIYICVPSPSTDDGRCDTSILEQTLKDLLFVLINNPIPIICKTTAPPSVYKRLQKQYSSIVHCPEFLTAANNVRDYLNSRYFVLGGDAEWCINAREIIRSGVPLVDDKFLIIDIKTAALYKYMMNCYLAAKVTFMNDFKNLADAEGIEWNSLKSLAIFDDRIGHTHMDVPGPDGKYGWGGACFPKDVSAIIKEASDIGIDFELIYRVDSINKRHRQ
jgi:nucleotide sugar dehydrogenase